MTAPDLKLWLVVLTLASQIAVFSFWAPYREWRRVRALEARYPREEYALAYRSTGQKPLWLRRLFAVLHALVGFGSIAFALTAPFELESMLSLMLYVLIAQLVVIVIDGLRAILIRRELRAGAQPAVRTAELRPRRIGDYVPMWLIAPAFVAWAVFAAVTTYALPRVQELVFWLTLPLVLVNVWLLVRMIQRIRGVLGFLRADPFMQAGDRRKVGQLHAGQLFRGSIICSVVTSITLLGHTDVVHVDRAYLAIGLSLYLQFGLVCLSIWLRRFYARVDFSAYRLDLPPRPANAPPI